MRPASERHTPVRHSPALYKWFLLVSAVVWTLGAPRSASATDIVIVTPYMQEPGTRLMVESFDGFAARYGWSTQLVEDTDNFDRRLRAMIDGGEKPEAIVINVAPGEIQSGLELANAEGIPVVGMDSERSHLLLSNVTSNGYSMAAETATYVVDALGGKGAVVMITYEDYAPVQKRGVVAEAIFENHEGITIKTVIVPDVDGGSFESARDQIGKLLDEFRDSGDIAAVWAAWDEPALGALAAIESRNRRDDGIVITGIDGMGAAKRAIARGSNLEATVLQDFEGIARQAALVIQRKLDDKGTIRPIYYVPAQIFTADSLR